MDKNYVMSQDDLDYVMSTLDKSSVQSAFSVDDLIKAIEGFIKRAHREYMASVKIGLTSKNYNERKKAFENALDVMRENNIEVLEHRFYRKPSDIIYSLDQDIRTVFLIRTDDTPINESSNQDFRRLVIWVVTGKEGRLPKVSKAKDKEISSDRIARSKTKEKLDHIDSLKEEYYLNHEELWK